MAGRQVVCVQVDAGPEFQKLFDELNGRIRSLERSALDRSSKISDLSKAGDDRARLNRDRHEDVCTRIGRLERAVQRAENDPLFLSVRYSALVKDLEKLEKRLNDVEVDVGLDLIIGEPRDPQSVCVRLRELEKQAKLNKDPTHTSTITIDFDRDDLIRGLHGITHALSFVGSCPARDHASTIVRQIEEALKV